MTEEEFAIYREHLVLAYAEAKVQAGNWPAGDAERLSEEAHRTLLPGGLATPAHHFYVARDDDRLVGTLWLAERDGDNGRSAYLYYIEVAEAERGKGYGKAMMAALETEVTALGLDSIQLHVFGDNTTARALYRDAGYAETNVVMSKRLR
ncbi:GNAT family N-acetyltransferase [Amycolatopsis magusensis]|uniref:Ribosomal protein S18 acetylase RimI-like enzyme n=1 Tax=Amycolatopsis magusensis TaxID=882444 RepID=A0ABS4PPY4_9PSEU|nr:GNAT family N-acetyltransferase [Amycolatopsis magusensis]MBP2181474.1 ribosomal protein S18 acetylase RimI-like enzyme [Amycolatopsis magusensis]MDI5977542.1 GNAT family N-acetyltransferase [Amycolatopsis magusensis]